MANNGNLKPWGPDNPPPKSPGRPRKRPMSEEYDDLLRELLPDKERRALGLPEGSTWARAMALARAREALTRGGTLAAKEIADRVEGKATQRIELSSPEDRGFEIRVRYANPQKVLTREQAADLKRQMENKTIDIAVTQAIVQATKDGDDE